ncbi:nuclear transport factor 2 family protein [Rhizobium sp. 3T7]|uniref:nuclear transport factor 2 family protein n=1 Tax=Rhizobium sp. 3T7 TaxID=2874922 RepID=UPI0021E2E26B|nr:nuclear transport factor 2 family protein [Rhizobium sp. 3T7]
MSFLGDSCVFRIAGSRHLAPLTDPVVGSAALRATMRHFIDTWEMKALEIVDIHVEGDVALVHRSGQMCHGTTDFDTEVMDKMTFDNGKVIECVEFIDTLQAASLLNIATISAAQR